MRNFSEQRVKEKKEALVSAKIRRKNRIRVNLTMLGIIAVLSVMLVVFFCVLGTVRGLFDSTPLVKDLEMLPEGSATTIYDIDGRPMQSLSAQDVDIEYVTIDQIPQSVQSAFVSVMDASFYKHSGLDVKNMFASIYSGLLGKGNTLNNATITQQLVQNQVYGGQRAVSIWTRFKNAVQEQYLSVQLEQKMDKDQILEYYLNTIHLGENKVGIQQASKYYFNKDVSQLSNSEAAVLAGLAENPSAYNPIVDQTTNVERRKMVLQCMLDQKYISEEEYEDALGDDVYSRIEMIHQKKSTINDNVNSYYVDAVIDSVRSDLKEKLGYSETQANNAIFREGLKIYSCQDTTLQAICDEVINTDSYYPEGTKSYLSYYLSVSEQDGSINEYNENDLSQYFEKLGYEQSLYYIDKKSAKKAVDSFRNEMLLRGGTVQSEKMHLIKQPQSSFILMEQKTGKVVSVVGGRGEKTQNRTMNRAVTTLKQPGSALQVPAVYAAALDSKKLTLATVFDDSEYEFPDTSQEVFNWNGEQYRGLISLRQAITNAVNTVAIKTFEQVSEQVGFDYLKRFQISSLVQNRKNEEGEISTDVQLSLALGEMTDGITNLQLTAAYAGIANYGKYQSPIFYTKIIDQNGNVLLDNESQEDQMMKPSSAWLLTEAMRSQIIEGISKDCSLDSQGVILAGQIGRTKDNTDGWFVGYSDYYTAGIWSGYDSEYVQENTTYPRLIWKEIMKRVHQEKELEKREFEKPSDIITAKICVKCGNLAVDGLCDQITSQDTVRTEYFEKGTAPTKRCDCHVKFLLCKESKGLATKNCPDTYSYVYLKKEEKTKTADSAYVIPERMKEPCKIHGSE